MNAYIDCDTTNETFEQLFKKLVVVSEDLLSVNVTTNAFDYGPLSECDFRGWLSLFKAAISLDGGSYSLCVKEYVGDLLPYTSCDNVDESIESLLKRLFVIDESGNVAIQVSNLGGDNAIYTSCENTDEQWQVLFRKLIYVAEDGTLVLSFIISSLPYVLYFECGMTDSLISVFKKLVYQNNSGNYVIMLNSI